MRVLVLSPFVPAFPGSGAPTRLYCLLRELASRHEFSLLASPRFGDSPDLEALTRVCRRFERIEPDRPEGRRRWQRWWDGWVGPPAGLRPFLRERDRAREALRPWLSESPPGLVQVEEAVLAPWIPAGFPVVVSVHNLLHRVERRMAAQARGWARAPALWEAFKLWLHERRFYRRPYRFVVTSEVDREGLLRLAPDAQVRLVPNGVDTSYFSPRPEQGGLRLAFTGKLEYGPNRDAVDWFSGEVLPLIRRVRPQTELEVAGLAPPEEMGALARSRKFTLVSGPPDIRPHLARAAVVVVPLRAGSGTRLKILEALAMGRAVVTTRLGAEGLEVKDGEHLLMADSPALFADRVLQLLGDERLRRALGEAGRRLVVERYDWRRIAPLLEAVYAEACR